MNHLFYAEMVADIIRFVRFPSQGDIILDCFHGWIIAV